MSWRDERSKVLRSQPPEPAPSGATAQPVQTTADARQNNLKDSGFPFDPARWIGEIDALMAELGKHDPRGGCWNWVERNLNDKWRQLMTAMKEIDTAFEEQCPDKLRQAIGRTRRLYQECVTAWKKSAT